MLGDPRVNFAIAPRNGKSGIDHPGIQVERNDELHEIYDRLQAADRPVLDEDATTCCYAQPEKSWITDSADLGAIRIAAYACCATETAQGVCAPKPVLAATAACCAPVPGGA